MPQSSTFKNSQLDTTLGSGSPATVFIAACTVAPDSDGLNFLEPVGGSYARLSITNNATNFPAASAGSKSLNIAHSFAKATGDWGTILAFAEFSVSSAGTARRWGILTTAQTVNTGSTIKFQIGGMVWT